MHSVIESIQESPFKKPMFIADVKLPESARKKKIFVKNVKHGKDGEKEILQNKGKD